MDIFEKLITFMYYEKIVWYCVIGVVLFFFAVSVLFGRGKK